MEPRPPDPLSRQLHKRVRELHRDRDLWVLEKPAGVLAHPNPPAARAANALLRGAFDAESESYALDSLDGSSRRVYLVHRLDQDTSGLILAAFSQDAALALKEDLYHRRLEKEYRALLLGAPEPPFGEWRDSLAKASRHGKVEVRVERTGAPNAETAYELVRIFPGTGLALVKLFPYTGRTHQLRVQAAWREVPIAGDERYGDFAANRFLRERIGLKRMFLHASRLVFRHPESGHRLVFTSELGRSLGESLEKLEKLGARVPRRRRRAASVTPRRRSRGRRGS